MASQFEIPGHQFYRFATATTLSDGLVGRVLPRAKASNSQRTNATRDIEDAYEKGELIHSKGGRNGEATTALLSLTGAQVRGYPSKKRSHYDDNVVATGLNPSKSEQRALVDARAIQDAMELKQKRLKSEIRREQCRTNQARYRNKQRNLQMRLETSVQQLRQELRQLKQRRQNVMLAEKTDQSPWTIVTEVFRIIENSLRSPWNLENDEDMQNDLETRRNVAYLHKALASDVAIGELKGIDAVVEHWRCFSQNFGDARLQLQQVESVAPGVIRARARLQVVTTELTVRHMFPNLSDAEPQSKYDVHPTLRERLLGHQLDCCVSVDFLFDDENGRVARLEFQPDIMPEVLRVLGNIDDVTEVFNS
ncbi:Bzip transcription factor [Phytophthora palmivora]|uniref:Bzip transcription factor n=1 Tax=Phytophthora palmivora TaxID=4796 RepID=A0A2P4XRF0_9STRA|nr:Bzip transcription factor [Phytophthora palmivora]